MGLQTETCQVGANCRRDLLHVKVPIAVVEKQRLEMADILRLAGPSNLVSAL